MYNTIRNLGTTALIAGGLLASLCSAQAQVTATFTTASAPTYNISYIDKTGSSYFEGNEGGSAVYAGNYGLSINGQPAQEVFCTDIWDNVGFGESWTGNIYPTTLPSPSTDYLAQASVSLYPVAVTTTEAYQIDSISANYLQSGLPPVLSTISALGTVNEESDAQLAIWDLETGGHVAAAGAGGYGYAGGYDWFGTTSSYEDFSVTSGISAADMAEIAYIESNAVMAMPSGSFWLEASDVSSGRAQDFTFIPGPEDSPFLGPEPASFTAFGFVAFGIVALALRRRVRSQATGI